MRLSKIVILSILLLFSATTFSQKRRASQNYNALAYKKSAEIYTKLYEKGNDSYDVISRIADSYYHNTNTIESEKWYQTLMEKYPNKVKEIHIFRYAHSLKGNKKYDQADVMMKKLEEVNNGDKRTKDLLDNPDYYEDFRKHKYDFTSFHNLAINTKYSDFGGFVFDEKLYFSSAKPSDISKDIYKWNEQPFLNLYQGGMIVEEKKLEVLKSDLHHPIQTKYHESNAVITKDGSTMYFTRDNYYKGKKRTSMDKKMRLKLYRAKKVDGKWSDIYELPFNSDEYSVGHPALSPDEKKLYFVSDKPGGQGATDIYRVSIDGDSYGKPINLGPRINTVGREMFPFIASDNTLYFSSDGHLGLGGLDVFESLIYDNDTFGTAENLQAPFNSERDDFAFYIDFHNKRGFVSSNRVEGKGDDDIYSFILVKEKRRPDYDCDRTVEGVVVDANTGAILPSAKVVVYDAEEDRIKQMYADEKGSFSFKINCQSESYKLDGSKATYKGDSEKLITENYKDGDIIKLELTPTVVVPVATQVLDEDVIYPIYFNFDKSGIREGDSRPELDRVVDIMKRHPSLVVKIESHTDSRASKSYNRRLSQRRADSTKKYMVSKGIAPLRIISTKGYGEDKLLNNCDDNTECTEEEHQLNRRSYFIIVSGSGARVENTPPKIIDRKPGL